jgi:hypothetical protein
MSTMTIQDVAKETGEFVTANKEIAKAGVYSTEITLNQYCKTLTKVQGKFPQFHSILTNVVQGYKAEWQALGEAQFKSKKLENFHQKVNYPVKPSEILHSWLAELYIENKKPEEMPISKYIIEELMAKVTDNLDDLSQSAVYDEDNFDGVYGFSLNGIAQQVAAALANVAHPAFSIPLSAITQSNILDQFKKYEKGLPKKMRKKLKRVFVSDNIKLMYADAYEQTYGTKVTYKDNDAIQTPLTKLEIVGLPGIPDNCIFSTVEGNLVRLIDIFDKPAITDIQILDYVMKIFMEFWLGYDFLINQLVYVAVFDGSDRGLGNAAQNALYYDSENLVVTP